MLYNIAIIILIILFFNVTNISARGECKNDRQKFCHGIRSKDKAELRKCMESNYAKFSKICKDAIRKRKQISNPEKIPEYNNHKKNSLQQSNESCTIEGNGKISGGLLHLTMSKGPFGMSGFEAAHEYRWNAGKLLIKNQGSWIVYTKIGNVWISSSTVMGETVVSCITLKH
ncbi:MAG: hypothetical protein L6Q54_10525 [Leptospiraceae bacterium]|nr:hypothetical protein [Leptospiraceae bacterium]MCK6381662.1 hypothetical protein [Leptospiraceae bacterium]